MTTVVRHSFLALCGLLSIVLILNACGRRLQNCESNTVVIGLVTPLTGDVQDLGKEMLAAAHLGIERANQEQSSISPGIPSLGLSPVRAQAGPPRHCRIERTARSD